MTTDLPTDEIERCIDWSKQHDDERIVGDTPRNARAQLAALKAKVAELCAELDSQVRFNAATLRNNERRQSHLRHLLALWVAKAGGTDDSVLAGMTRKELSNA